MGAYPCRVGRKKICPLLLVFLSNPSFSCFLQPVVSVPLYVVAALHSSSCLKYRNNPLLLQVKAEAILWCIRVYQLTSFPSLYAGGVCVLINNMGGDVLTAGDGVMDAISSFLYPAVRIFMAGLVVWYSSGASS